MSTSESPARPAHPLYADESAWTWYQFVASLDPRPASAKKSAAMPALAGCGARAAGTVGVGWGRRT